MTRWRGPRAFCTAFCAAFCAMLLGVGLFVADCNSRRMRDGARAEEAYAGAVRQMTLTAKQRAFLTEGAHLLPVRLRLVGGVWLGEWVAASLPWVEKTE